MLHLLLAVIYLSFISLGLPDSLLGSAWPSMYQGFGVPVSYSGIIFFIISVGTVISSLQSDRLTRRLGAGKVTAVSVGMTAAALFGFSVSGSLWPGGRERGRGVEQLCSAAFRQPSYELASLHVGAWSLNWAVHHGGCVVIWCRVACGVSNHQCDAAGTDCHYCFEPAALEDKSQC